MVNSKETLSTLPEREQNSEALRAEAERRQEQLDESRRERAAETERKSVEEARKDIEKLQEKERAEAPKSEKLVKNKEKLNRTPTRKDRATSYQKVMQEVELHMTPAQRTFSRFIHHPAVERTSEVVGATVARPAAVLSGALFAFIFTLAIYSIARIYGYPLSGAETIAGFIVGWLVGNVFDYFRTLITRKR